MMCVYLLGDVKLQTVHQVWQVAVKQVLCNVLRNAWLCMKGIRRESVTEHE